MNITDLSKLKYKWTLSKYRTFAWPVPHVALELTNVQKGNHYGWALVRYPGGLVISSDEVEPGADYSEQEAMEHAEAYLATVQQKLWLQSSDFTPDQNVQLKYSWQQVSDRATSDPNSMIHMLVSPNPTGTYTWAILDAGSITASSDAVGDGLPFAFMTHAQKACEHYYRRVIVPKAEYECYLEGERETPPRIALL